MKELKLATNFRAEPEDVYAAFTNPFTIELWTGFPAKMSTEPGSEFSLWEGDIVGQNLAFEENKMVQQAWFFGEEQPSVVTIKIHPDKKGSRININQTNIPDEAFDNIKAGWEENYLEALHRFLDIEDE
jgi:activator of HSP90 ATPase